MGIIQSMTTGQRLTLWAVTGVLAGNSLATWLYTRAVDDYEVSEDVTCRKPKSTSPSTSNLKAGNLVMWIVSLSLFLLLTYYIFVPTSTTNKLEVALGGKRSLPSAIMGGPPAR